MGLETLLRFNEASRQGTVIASKGLSDVELGHEIPVDPFNDYSQLGYLIDRHNVACPGEPIEGRLIIDLRHALAHGRLFLTEDETRTKLVKFSAPKNGKVRVTFAAQLDEPWFDAQRKLIHAATRAAMKAGAKVGVCPDPPQT